MLKVFSFLLVFSTEAMACKLRHEVVSLSSPVTGVLQELGLLKDPQLKAISLFHPVKKSDYSGTRLGGGVFLSKRDMEKYRQAHLFYDESGETTRRLKEIPLKGRIQIRTRAQDPFAISEMALYVLESHLENCATPIQRFKSWMATEKTFLLGRPSFTGQVFFFLGEIKGAKLPDLMIVNDGPMLFWLRHGKLSTFQTPLSYLPWGEKWRATLKGSERFVGLVKSEPEDRFRLAELSKQYFNTFDPDALSPGPWQIHFMRRFAEKFH